MACVQQSVATANLLPQKVDNCFSKSKTVLKSTTFNSSNCNY